MHIHIFTRQFIFMKRRVLAASSRAASRVHSPLWTVLSVFVKIHGSSKMIKGTMHDRLLPWQGLYPCMHALHSFFPTCMQLNLSATNFTCKEREFWSRKRRFVCIKIYWIIKRGGEIVQKGRSISLDWWHWRWNLLPLKEILYHLQVEISLPPLLPLSTTKI